jgi:hypothetical protein
MKLPDAVCDLIDMSDMRAAGFGFRQEMWAIHVIYCLHGRVLGALRPWFKKPD